MDDLISRQAAIDRLTEYGNGRAVFISVGEAIIRIEQLPPAQPEQLGTDLAEVGTDCISRQALLDKFEPWLKVKDYNDGELNMLKAVLYEIRFMRPAQPELKKGKWIRNGWAITCSECGYDMPYTVRRFCPNCGADMRGEQDDKCRQV